MENQESDRKIRLNKHHDSDLEKEIRCIHQNGEIQSIVFYMKHGEPLVFDNVLYTGNDYFCCLVSEASQTNIYIPRENVAYLEITTEEY